MKTSYNWLTKHISISKSINELTDKLTLLGLECSYKKIDKSFKNVIIGKVINCEKHPDSDHLNVCEVNIGNESNLQIICGAPNVKKNILVPVAPIGATLSNGTFKIKKVKLRGIESNGMICSEKELGLGPDNDGILIFDYCDQDIGTPIENKVKISNDYLIEFDMTPNRGDCFSHLGVAREIALIDSSKVLNTEYKYENSNFKIEDNVKINIHESKLCKRYSSVLIRNITVEESPNWLKESLELIGQKSINSIVDIANYVMFDLGQPLHAFDYDLINGKEIHVKKVENKQKFISINNAEYLISKNDLVICDSEKPIAIAGVIGGKNSCVSHNTKNILVESAVFDEISVRKTSKFHDLSTESSKRFERGVDIEFSQIAMRKFVQMVLDICGGEVSYDEIDIYPNKVSKTEIDFNLKSCNKFLGTQITENNVLDIFKSLNIEILKIKDSIRCKIPFYRNDLTRTVDLYEEVARAYGYDNIPSMQSCSMPYSVLIKDSMDIENLMRQFLISNGCNEHYSNSLVNIDNTELNNNIPVKISNPLSQEMSYMRNSIIPGLLDALSYNERRKQKNVNLFEIGSIQYLESDKNNFIENRILGISWLANDIKFWQKKITFDFYKIKGFILELLKNMNFSNIKLIPSESSFADFSMKIIIDDNHEVGNIYELNSIIKKKHRLKSDIFVAEVNINRLKELQNRYEFKYVKPSQFPSVIRDISILVDSKIQNLDLEKSIYKKGTNLLKNVVLFDYYKDKNLDSNKISISYSLKFESNSRTLKDKEVDILVENILSFLKKKYNAKQR